MRCDAGLGPRHPASFQSCIAWPNGPGYNAFVMPSYQKARGYILHSLLSHCQRPSMKTTPNKSGNGPSVLFAHLLARCCTVIGFGTLPSSDPNPEAESSGSKASAADPDMLTLGGAGQGGYGAGSGCVTVNVSCFCIWAGVSLTC